MVLETLIRLEPFCAADCAARVVDGLRPSLLVLRDECCVASIPLGLVEYGYIQRAVVAPQRLQSAMRFVIALQRGYLDSFGPTP